MAGLYFHIPFCRQRCSYCDFYFVTGEREIEPFVEALKHEVLGVADEFRREAVETVYVGGGTPSRLTVEQLAEIRTVATKTFQIEPGAEFTIEVNPDDCSLDYLAAIRALGFTRLSIGVQSLKSSDLEFMRRAHSLDESQEAVRQAREVGFDEFSIDLIFGLPDQSPSDWTRSLRFALELEIPHVSTYGLTVEPDTLLHKWVRDGQVDVPDNEATADMYLEAILALESAGYHHYEISSFARPGSESRHNRAYWNHDNYLGFGPSAHSFWRAETAQRWNNVRSVRRYLEWAGGDSTSNTIVENREPLSARILAEEYVMLGLRTSGGVDRHRLKVEYGYELNGTGEGAVANMAAGGLIEDDGIRIMLTASGKLLADSLAVRLCGDHLLQPVSADDSGPASAGL